MVDRFPLALIGQIPTGSLWRELVILFNAAIDDSEPPRPEVSRLLKPLILD